MPNTVNLDSIIRKVNDKTSVVPGEQVLVTIDLATSKAIEKTFLVRLGGNYQEYLIANNQNPMRNASGKLSTYFVRDTQNERTLAIDISFVASCPEGCEIKVAEALHGPQTPGSILESLMERWVREFIRLGDEGRFIDSFEAARSQLEKHIADRAHNHAGLKLQAKVALTAAPKVAQEIVVGPIEIGVRLHRYTEEQKITVEAGLALDSKSLVNAFLFHERQVSPEELFKRHFKEYFFQHVTFDQFTTDLQYPSFKQPLLQYLSATLKEIGRIVRFINIGTISVRPAPREFVLVTYDSNHSIHGRSQPVLIQNTVQLYCSDSVAFIASGVADLDAWVKNTLNVVLKRHLIGKTYVDLLLRFAPAEQEIKREMSARAASIGYRVDHLVSIPNLKELELTKPFLLEAEDTFETKLDGFEVQLKFNIKHRIPKLEAIEKYLNPGTDVKEAIKEMALAEARHCLRNVHPERFYLYFNHPKESATSANEDERLAVKDLLAKMIQDSLKREFKAEIFELTLRVGRTDLTDRYKNLCHVIRGFRVGIESPDPQATESLTLTGDFEFRGVYPDSAGWQRFSVLSLDLDGLQNQLETHLKAELKTFYQSGFMFQNRMGRNQVFNLIKNYAGIYMREEFGLMIHLTNLDRNTTLAEENQRRLLIELENNKLAAVIHQSELLVNNLKELRKKQVNVLSVSPIDKESLREISESIHLLEEELKTISSARFGTHRLASRLEGQSPDELPPANGDEPPATSSELKSGVKGQLSS